VSWFEHHFERCGEIVKRSAPLRLCNVRALIKLQTRGRESHPNGESISTERRAAGRHCSASAHRRLPLNKACTSSTVLWAVPKRIAHIVCKSERMPSTSSALKKTKLAWDFAGNVQDSTHGYNLCVFDIMRGQTKLRHIGEHRAARMEYCLIEVATASPAETRSSSLFLSFCTGALHCGTKEAGPIKNRKYFAALLMLASFHLGMLVHQLARHYGGRQPPSWEQLCTSPLPETLAKTSKAEAMGISLRRLIVAAKSFAQASTLPNSVFTNRQ